MTLSRMQWLFYRSCTLVTVSCVTNADFHSPELMRGTVVSIWIRAFFIVRVGGLLRGNPCYLVQFLAACWRLFTPPAAYLDSVSQCLRFTPITI